MVYDSSSRRLVEGYPLENRTYNSSEMRYDFTGKERDDETSYDYFPACRSGSAGRGARYYDSRIGRWGQVEPLLIQMTIDCISD